MPESSLQHESNDWTKSPAVDKRKSCSLKVLGTPVVAEFKKEQADIEASTRRIRTLFGFFKLD